MASRRLLGAAGMALTCAAALVSGQGQLLPTLPRQAYGGSVSPAYDGWYANPDGSRTYLMGYYNRNTDAEIDIPIGPDNHFEPGDPDRGQPTHFRTNRMFGMFTIVLPATTPPSERLWWVLAVNGVRQRVPINGASDYNITPNKASEESPGGKYNTPPILRLSESEPRAQGAVASMAKAAPRTAVVDQAMPLELWVEDDGLYTNGSNTPFIRDPQMVEIIITKYRGPGAVRVGDGLDKLATLKGGKPGEPYAGKASTTLSFTEPGEYFVHVTVNDLSGAGGGSTGCCWTTGMLKVAVAASAR